MTYGLLLAVLGLLEMVSGSDPRIYSELTQISPPSPTALTGFSFRKKNSLLKLDRTYSRLSKVNIQFVSYCADGTLIVAT